MLTVKLYTRGFLIDLLIHLYFLAKSDSLPFAVCRGESLDKAAPRGLHTCDLIKRLLIMRRLQSNEHVNKISIPNKPSSKTNQYGIFTVSAELCRLNLSLCPLGIESFDTVICRAVRYCYLGVGLILHRYAQDFQRVFLGTLST